MGGVGTRSRRTWLRLPGDAGNKEVSSQGNGSGTLRMLVWGRPSTSPVLADCLLVVGTVLFEASVFSPCKWDNDHTNHLCEFL